MQDVMEAKICPDPMVENPQHRLPNDLYQSDARELSVKIGGRELQSATGTLLIAVRSGKQYGLAAPPGPSLQCLATPLGLPPQTILGDIRPAYLMPPPGRWLCIN